MNFETAQELIQKNNQYYEKQAQSFSYSRERDWALFLSLLKYIKKGDSVLDIGSGNGRLYPLIVQKGANYLGIDTSRKILRIAKKMYSQGEFREGDLLEISPPPYFEVVLLIAVLHHIPGKEWRQKAVQNIFNILKPGGYALISNWNLFQKSFWRIRWSQNFNKIFGKSKLDWNDLIFKKKRYYHGFKKREIARLLQKTGFKVLENYYKFEGKRVGRWKGRNLVTIAEKICNSPK